MIEDRATPVLPNVCVPEAQIKRLAMLHEIELDDKLLNFIRSVEFMVQGRVLITLIERGEYNG